MILIRTLCERRPRVVLLSLGAEDSNECNPECNGHSIVVIPSSMMKLLPPGYSHGNNSNRMGGVSPTRARLQSEAACAQESQARVMQRDSIRSMGRGIGVGSLVQIKIPDVDRGKLDPPYLTTLVVEV